jgi:hypothetical protein
MTLGELFSTYLEHHAKPHKKSWLDDQEAFNLHLAAWKLRKISEIRRMDVVTLHSRIGNRAPYAANRVIALVRCMFGKAIEWGWKGENPATNIKPFKEHKRERFLQPEEVPNFFNALGEEPDETFRLLLRAPDRRQALEREAIKWKRLTSCCYLTIPDSKSKSGESVNRCAHRHGARVLENRKVSSKANGYFPATQDGPFDRAKPHGSEFLSGPESRISDSRRQNAGSWQAAVERASR